jgi:hypothetical protein
VPHNERRRTKPNSRAASPATLIKTADSTLAPAPVRAATLQDDAGLVPVTFEYQVTAEQR